MLDFQLIIMDKRGDPGGNNQWNDNGLHRHFAARDGTGQRDRILDERAQALIRAQLRNLLPETHHHLNRNIGGGHSFATMSDDDRTRLMIAILDEVQRITQDDDETLASTQDREGSQDTTSQLEEQTEEQNSTERPNNGNENWSSDEGGSTDDPPSR